MAEVFGLRGHVVAEIIETKLVVGAVCDVGIVSLFAGGRAEVAEAFIGVVFVDVGFVVNEAGIVDDDAYG